MAKARQLKAERTKQPRTLVPVVESGDAIDNEYLMSLFSCSRRTLNTVSAIIDDIFDEVAEEVYKRHLKRQQIPFSVKLAAQAILELVECNFLSVQPLESEEEEDEELEPINIHPWAQGMIPRKFAPAAKVASPDDVKENEILTEIERPPKPAMTMEKRMQKKNKADNELVESSEVKKKPIQEQAFIPGWSKRPPGFHYVPRTGAVLNKVNLEETESFRKMTRSLSTEKTAEQTPLRALNILKNNLSKNAVFDADGNILATLPLAPCSTATSSRVRIRPAEKTVKGDAQPSRSTSRTGPGVLWRIGPKQEVRLHDCKLLEARTTEQTGTKKNDLTIPPVTYTEDRSNPKSNMSALAEAIRLAPGVSLWDGTNVFSSRPQAHSGDNSR